MKKAKQLLDKYFEGETTLEEEAQLRQYFQSEEIPQDLEVYRPLFSYFTEPIPSYSEKAEAKLLQALEAEEQSSDRKEKSANIRRMGGLRLWAAAASIALLLSLGFWWIQPAKPAAVVAETESSAEIDWSKYEVESPEVAYQNMSKAFNLVANKMEEGKEQTRKGFKEIHEAQEKLR